MKKTIAKIMAAAMVLSAVPAVALPTLTADAAANENVSISTASSETDDDGTYVSSSDGDTGISVGEGTTIKYGVGVPTAAQLDAAASQGVYVAIVDSADSSASGTTKTLMDVVKISVKSNGHLVVAADTTVSDYAKVVMNAVKAQDNTITLRLYSDSYGTDGTSKGTLAVSSKSSYYEAVVNFGGYADSTGTIKEGVTAQEGTLADGDIYIKLASTTKPEVEVLRGKNDNMDGNDNLRGETLNLNTVSVGGYPYTVVKIGAQALKKAHMKKFYAENARTIGKGALRNAKQVTKVDISDANKVRKIHSKAFYSCKNLKTIAIDGRKLKTIGSGAFSGVKKNCNIKIKAKKTKYESDKKMIQKNGGNKNLKFTRVAP